MTHVDNGRLLVTASHNPRLIAESLQATKAGFNETICPSQWVSQFNGLATETMRVTRRFEVVSARRINAAFLILREIVKESLNMQESHRSPQ